MRDFFAILVIIAAVVVLGVFRVPSDTALLDAGVRAEAQGALYQARHPLSVTVKTGVVTVTGRVESAEAAEDVVTRLRDVPGAQDVVNELIVLPNVAPFALSVAKSAEGVVFEGHVPRDTLSVELATALDVEPLDLPVAAGAPDDAWGDVALRGAQALALLIEGRMDLTDSVLALRGVAHLPDTVARIEAALADLPEDYQAKLSLEAIDDGRPYALLITRDRRMGLAVRGKLPPDMSLPDLGPVQDATVVNAPLPLDAPGFEAAVMAALPVFRQMAEGSLSVTPGLVTLSGGPLDLDAEGALAQALPDGYAELVSLVPKDSGVPLALTASHEGARLVLQGHVPLDFALTSVAPLWEQVDDLQMTRRPYPDLAGWSDRALTGLRALALLERGTLAFSTDSMALEGVAAFPKDRFAVKQVLGAEGTMDVVLRDDGKPPAFTLRYDAASGASVRGKLPFGLSTLSLASALGLSDMRGAPAVSSQGDGAAALEGLSATQPWMPLLEQVELTSDGEALVLEVTLLPGAPDVVFATLAAAIGPVAEVTKSPFDPPSQGMRRIHALTGQAQVFRDGYWLPQVALSADADSCAEASADVAQPRFVPARFQPQPMTVLAFDHLAAIARACTRQGDLRLVIGAATDTAGNPVIDGQVARRRAVAIRDALITRGVPRTALRAQRVDNAGPGDLVTFEWVAD